MRRQIKRGGKSKELYEGQMNAFLVVGPHLWNAVHKRTCLRLILYFWHQVKTLLAQLVYSILFSLVFILLLKL